MAAATFTQVAASDLYWSNDNATTRPFGFISTNLQKSQVSLAEAWADTAGVFFAASYPIPPPSVAILLLTLKNWLTAQGWPTAGGMRLLWVELATDGTTVLSILPLAAAAGPPSTLLQTVSVDFKGYLLSLPAGSTLAPSPAGDALLVGGPTVFCAANSPYASYATIGQRVSVAVAGNSAGSVAFAIDLAADGSNGQPTDFENLSLGTRYGWRTGDVSVDYLHVATLHQPVGTTRLWAALQAFGTTSDPCSRFSFLPPSPDDAAPVPCFTSDFLTPEGRTVLLTPTAGAPSASQTGGLVFARQPLFWSDDPAAPCAYYLTPDGQFTVSVDGLTTPTDAQLRLVCGLGVLEQVQGVTASALQFTPGNAFSPQIGAPLTPLATTARVEAGALSGATYYVQPDAAPFYGPQQQASAFLGFVDIPAASLPGGQVPLPMLGYANLAAGPETETAVQVERTIVGPARTAVALVAPPPKPAPAPLWGLTPAGLMVGFDPNSWRDWSWMGLANVAATTQPPDVVFNDVTWQMQTAVQSAGPFVVMANPDVVMNAATITYQLSTAALQNLKAAPPPCFANFNWAELEALTSLYSSEAAFVTALKSLATPPSPSQTDVLLRAAGIMQATIDGWTFDLAPRTWPPAPADETSDGQPETRQGVMIVKMDRTLSLAQWIEQLPASSWPDAAMLPGSTNINDTADVLRASVALARARRDASENRAASPYAHFLDVVLIEPTWTGTLMLNATVPLDQLPTDLQAIEAGIKQELFYAHHVGFEHGLVSVNGPNLALSPDRIFGVIDYEDPLDLTLDPQSPQDFQFKALQITVGFARSKVSSFTGRVELFVNHLFGAVTRKYPTTVGNNLILDGVKILEAGDDGNVRTGYRFASADDNVYQLAGSALQTVSITRSSLALNSALSTQPTSIVTDFTLGGGLMFQPTNGFDMFSYGPVAPPPEPPEDDADDDDEGEWIDTPHGRARVLGRTRRLTQEERDAPAAPVDDDEPPDAPSPSGLAFANLIVRMTYEPSSNTAKFELLTDDAAFDLTNSQPRPDGLAARLFAVPKRFVKASASSGFTPPDLGYAPASCGAKQAKLTAPWYGIEYGIELGSLGALGADTTVTLYVLAAWSVDASTDTPPISLGVRLPGAGLDSFELALQGIVKLGFAAIQFDTYTAADGGLGYLLRLRDFGLSLLGKRFPSGHLNVLITAAPDATGAGKLGWFAGYVEPDASPTTARSFNRRLLATRAIAPPRN